MSARAFKVLPGALVSSSTDTSAVLVSTGVMSLGLTVAEARDLSMRLGRAADDVEHQLMRPRVVTRRNPADICDCGNASVITEYRNGREIGVCGNCR